MYTPMPVFSPTPLYRSPFEQQREEEFLRVQQELENLKARLGAVGQKAPKPSPLAQPLLSVLKGMSRVGSGAVNALREFTPAARYGDTPDAFDPLSAFMRGLKGEETVTGKDVMRDLGVSDKPWFEANLGPLTIAPNLAGLLGTATDVLNPLDPLNWLMFGAGKLATSPVKGAEALTKAFGQEGAEAVTKALGTKAVENLTASTASDLLNAVSLTARKKGLENLPELIQVLSEGMVMHGVKPSTVINPTARHLALRLKLPGVNKTLAALDVPGTQYLHQGLQSLGSVLGKTPIGKAGKSLQELFSTTATREATPTMVWRRLRNLGPEADEVAKFYGFDNVEGLIEGLTKSELVPGGEGQRLLMQRLKDLTRTSRQTEVDFLEKVSSAFSGIGEEGKTRIRRALFDDDIRKALVGKELEAFTFYKDTMKDIVKQYADLGVTFTPIDAYFPLMFNRAPTKSDLNMLESVFGTGVHKVKEDDIIRALAKQDPNLLTRTTQALDPEVINKVLESPLFLTDPETALARRGVRAIRGMEAAKALSDIAQEFGFKVDDVAKLAALPQGYKMVRPVVSGRGRISLEAVAESELAKGATAWIMPGEFANIYNQYTDLLFNPASKSAFGRLFDNVTRAYRTVTYMWNPGHLPRDFTSNIYNLWLGDVRSPVPYMQSLGVFTDPNKVLKLGGEVGEVSGKKLLDMAYNSGAIDVGMMAQEFAQAGKDWSFFRGGAIGKYTNVMRKASMSVDNFARMAGFIDRLSKGDTVEQAAGFVKKFLFDYTDLTPFEQKWMRRVIPFYTYMRKNMPLQIETLLTQPGKLAASYKAVRGLGEEPSGDVPDFIKEQAGVRIGQGHLLTGLPFQDLARIPTSGKQLRSLLSSTNPLIRTPIEMIINQSLFSGVPLESYTGQREEVPLSSVLRMLGVKPPTVPSRTTGYALEQIAPLRNLDIMLDPKHPRQMARILSVLGGLQIYPSDWATKASTFEQRDNLRDFIRFLEASGKPVPSVRDLEKAGIVPRQLGKGGFY